MPQIPLVNAPESSGQGAANPAHVSAVLAAPVRAPSIRANTDAFAAEGQAGRNLGNAVAGLGAETMDLATRTKRATDLAFITRSQTQMQGAAADFENWTKTNPDPSTWQEELDARISASKEDIQGGAQGLSTVAKQHLENTLFAWETGTRKKAQHQATEQNLNIAQASFKEFIDQATLDNDLPAIEAKVEQGVAAGIFHPTTGQAIVKRARVQVATNQANSLIDANPFEAEKLLTAKNEDGSYRVLDNLSASARETLFFRAHKAAAETRSNTMKEWASMVADAQNGRGPMPDREAIDEEAKQQGISPKWVGNLFKAPTPLDPHEFGRVYTAISSYNPADDPSATRLGELVGEITSFKDPEAKRRMDELLTAKLKPATPDNPLKGEVAKFGEASLKDMFTIGGYGQFKETIKNPTFAQGSRPEFKTVINPAQKQAAETVWARNLTLFHEWIKAHPQATPEEAQKFINGLNAQKATNNASRLIINQGAFGFGK